MAPVAAQEIVPLDHGTDIPCEEYTTLMLKNIPKHVDRSMLLQMLSSAGLDRQFDFIYLPCDFKSGQNLGYAFVNLITHELAAHAFKLLRGSCDWGCEACEVAWRNKHQGLENNIENIRNSAVMHPLVPDKFKPLLFHDGVIVNFPPSTKMIPMSKKMLAAISSSESVVSIRF